MDHVLTLKVMRLTRPALSSSIISFYGDNSSDLLHGLGNADGDDDLGLGQSLVLPQSFGSIYLGETFVSYVSLHNDSATQSCVEVALKCDLQTATQRIPVHQSDRAKEFLSGTSMDKVLSHEVKELGTHILVCEVSYALHSRPEERLSFRKFFKFQVLKPLDVRTKFYNAESDEVVLEAQVQNATHAPLCLERVHLDPSPLFDVSSLNETDEGQSVFGEVNAIRPQDSRQYLFSLVPKPEIRIKPKLIKGVTNIGKLDIVWRTNLGDKGRLQTNQLQRMAPSHGDVRFIVQSVPSVVELQQLFSIKATIVNNSESKLILEMRLDDNETAGSDPSVMSWCGTTRIVLGDLDANATLLTELHAVPHRSGLLSVSGVSFFDILSQRAYAFDNVCQVYVCEDTRLISALGDIKEKSG